MRSNPLRIALVVGLVGLFQANLAFAGCPLSVSGMSTQLYLESSGQRMHCVWPGTKYEMEVYGPSNDNAYCIVPTSTGLPRAPEGFTPSASCLDATYGDRLYPFPWRLTTHDPLPSGGITGGLSPYGCSGSNHTLEHVFSYPECAATNCTPPPNDLKLWLPLDESSGTTVRDIRQSVSGTRSGASITSSGRVSRALSFDGVDDLVTIPSPSAANLYLHDFTVDAWIKTSKANGIIVAKRDNTNTGWLLMVYSGRLMLQMGQGGTWVNYGGIAYSGPRVDDGQWHFVAVTVDRDSTTGGKLWVDGNLVYTFNPGTFTNRTLNNSAPLLLGQTGQGDTYAIYQGVIDEVEIFHRVLAESELDAIHAAGSYGKCKSSPATCGNNLCESGESCSSCPGDCGTCAVCGDGLCTAGQEACLTCSVDCGACTFCGDGLCNGRETCSTCSNDCGPCSPSSCDFDGICEFFESSWCADCCNPQIQICPQPAEQ